jgi:hypothetical protein
VLEDGFEAELRAIAAPSAGAAPQGDAGDVASTLFALVAADDGPSVSRFLERKGSPEHWREFLVHRSVYQLKEADPHAWGIPRLTGRAKAALVEIEADEFGGGIPERMHSTMFAQTLREVGIDATYGAFVDDVPAVTLAHANAMSLLGLHRRLRGALVGHLAAFEMTSSVPNRRYANGLRRLGFGPAATAYFDEHVEADAVHEQIAAHDLAAALVAAEPELAQDVVLGVRIALALDARLGHHLLQAWTAGTSSLPAPLGAGAAA